MCILCSIDLFIDWGNPSGLPSVILLIDLVKVVNTQSIDGLPSGYMRFLLDLYGKSTTRRHGFEMEGTLTTIGTQ